MHVSSSAIYWSHTLPLAEVVRRLVEYVDQLQRDSDSAIGSTHCARQAGGSQGSPK